MKRLGWLFAAGLVMLLFAGLFFRGFLGNERCERTEFMFDTQCTVVAYGDNAKEAVGAAFDRLEEIHRSTDFYSQTSEVAKINKADTEVELSEDVKNIITVALSVAEESGGAFDITVAPVVSLWDFSGEGRVPHKNEIQEKLLLVGIDKLSYDGKLSLKKAHKEVKIDLGGAAKGYAGDEAIRVLMEHNATAAVVDLGGNITCFGENPDSKSGKWRIGLQKPFSPTGEYDEVIEIQEGAVVTSGTYQRYFEKDGRKYHHIIDPKTGYPSDNEYSGVTIVAKSSLLADCLATACFVLGEEEGRALAEKYNADIYIK